MFHVVMCVTSTILGYDVAHPMLVVLDCEDDVDLTNLFKEKRHLFEARLQDVDWLQTQKFYIIDGAHRHHLAQKFREERVHCVLCL
jgi:hypothetical protein